MQIFSASYILPISSPPLAGGAIAVDNGRIVDVGTVSDLCRSYSAEVCDFPGGVILPGLVNAHSHLELTHFPSWKLRKGIDYLPRTYVDWVIQVIKIRRALTRAELVHSVREGIRKSLECGTTAIGEILTDRSLVPLYAGSLLSGRLYFEALGHDPARCEELFRSLEDSFASFDCGRFAPGLSPHAPHTLSAAFHQEMTTLASRFSLPSTIHLAESPDESAFFHDSSGGIADQLFPMVGWEPYITSPLRTTPTAFLDSLGALDSTVTAVHCVHITPADADILKSRGVSVVLCPRSNDRLALGRAPAALLKKVGIPLALGTDSLASNDSLSMWDEMRFLLKRFPETFSHAEALEMATLGAARALHLEGETGSLEKGKRADFLVVKATAPSAPAAVIERVVEESRIEGIYIAGASTEPLP